MRREEILPVANVHIQLKDPSTGRIVDERFKKNVWTLTGREYVVERLALASVSPDRVPVREDCIYYMGVGVGAHQEVESVTGLASPVVYRSGEFLAPVKTPPTYPADASGTSRTSIRFSREFGPNEISLGATMEITEAGLYTDGDPGNDNEPGCPTSLSAAGSRAPVAYYSDEPLIKQVGLTIILTWEVRIT